jgi:serine protease Do
MLQKLAQRYWNGCLMLLNMGENSVNCLGTAFLVNEKGWMLTAAHLVVDLDKLAVSAPPSYTGFAPSYSGKVQAIAVKKLRVDQDADLALLAPEQSFEIQLPPDMFGNSEVLEPGTDMLYLGFAFGHMNLPVLSAGQAILGSKIMTRGGARQLVIDNDARFGMVGGPVISAATGQVVGIITGGFNPFKELPDSAQTAGRSLPPGVAPACASVIEAGVRLIQAESEAED